MKTIKNLIYVMAGAFGVSFLDGMFNLGFPGDFYTFIGLIEVVCIVWLIIAINLKNYHE